MASVLSKEETLKIFGIPNAEHKFRPHSAVIIMHADLKINLHKYRHLTQLWLGLQMNSKREANIL